jgi:hypothetical protein
MKKKKAAMEMSVGTIVTIVLLMTVLILGLVLVRSIFSGAVENIDGIDQAVKNEINKLFSEDASRKIVVYPSSRFITIQKGTNNLGFGFSIRNVDDESAKFTYTVSASEASCSIRLNEADDFISLGSKGQITLAAGTFMDDPVFVRYNIPDDAPPCEIRYTVEVLKGTTVYGSSIDVDLKVVSE